MSLGDTFATAIRHRPRRRVVDRRRRAVVPRPGLGGARPSPSRPPQRPRTAPAPPTTSQTSTRTISRPSSRRRWRGPLPDVAAAPPASVDSPRNQTPTVRSSTTTGQAQPANKGPRGMRPPQSHRRSPYECPLTALGVSAAKSCDVRTLRVWLVGYGPGQGPAFGQVNGGAFVSVPERSRLIVESEPISLVIAKDAFVSVPERSRLISRLRACPGARPKTPLEGAPPPVGRSGEQRGGSRHDSSPWGHSRWVNHRRPCGVASPSTTHSTRSRFTAASSRASMRPDRPPAPRCTHRPAESGAARRPVASAAARSSLVGVTVVHERRRRGDIAAVLDPHESPNSSPTPTTVSTMIAEKFLTDRFELRAVADRPLTGSRWSRAHITRRMGSPGTTRLVRLELGCVGQRTGSPADHTDDGPNAG